MRVLDTPQRYTQIVCRDNPGPGGACHQYVVRSRPDSSDPLANKFAEVSFQKGPVAEAGVNGCHNEDLLHIIADRLTGFQSGEFACRENDMALQHIWAAIEVLARRTKRRVAAGIEGTSQKMEGEGQTEPQPPQPHDPFAVLAGAREECRLLVHVASRHADVAAQSALNNDAQRWVSIGRTNLQQGLMAIERGLKGSVEF